MFERAHELGLQVEVKPQRLSSLDFVVEIVGRSFVFLEECLQLLVPFCGGSICFHSRGGGVHAERSFRCIACLNIAKHQYSELAEVGNPRRTNSFFRPLTSTSQFPSVLISLLASPALPGNP